VVVGDDDVDGRDEAICLWRLWIVVVVDSAAHALSILVRLHQRVIERDLYLLDFAHPERAVLSSPAACTFTVPRWASALPTETRQLRSLLEVAFRGSCISSEQPEIVRTAQFGLFGQSG
jgi:hypothetical protein